MAWDKLAGSIKRLEEDIERGRIRRWRDVTVILGELSRCRFACMLPIDIIGMIYMVADDKAIRTDEVVQDIIIKHFLNQVIEKELLGD